MSIKIINHKDISRVIINEPKTYNSLSFKNLTDLIKVMKDRGISSKNAFKLLRGQNIPYTGYEGRMEKRLKDAQKFARDRNEIVNRNYFYPKLDFKKVVREYKNKKLNVPEPVETPVEEPKKPLINFDNIKNIFGKAPIQTPPLPNTPMPMVQTARADVNPNTNLTRSQEALLSPEEKVIASRTT